MTGFLTILGAVAGAIFSPLLVFVLSLLTIITAFLWACFCGSQDAREVGITPRGTLMSWVAFLAILPLGVTLAIFVMQFELFAWVLQ
ncbi:MAG TPA: hypothetical protein VJR06_04955 [Nitrososphaerales archaeon]|nr:hypothetical protein [Nitrososphaerales archaeon]